MLALITYIEVSAFLDGWIVLYRISAGCCFIVTVWANFQMP